MKRLNEKHWLAIAVVMGIIFATSVKVSIDVSAEKAVKREIEYQVRLEEELARLAIIEEETNKFEYLMNKEYHVLIAQSIKDVNVEEINKTIEGFDKLNREHLADEIAEYADQYTNELKELLVAKEKHLEEVKVEQEKKAEVERVEKEKKEKENAKQSNNGTTNKPSNQKGQKGDPFDTMPAELKKGLTGIKVGAQYVPAGAAGALVGDGTVVAFANNEMRMHHGVAYHEVAHLYGRRTGFDSTPQWIDIYNSEWKGKGKYGSNNNREAFAETIAKVFVGGSGHSQPANTSRSEQYVKELFGMVKKTEKPTAPSKDKEYTQEEIVDMRGMAQSGRKADKNYNIFEHHGSKNVIGTLKSGTDYYYTNSNVTNRGDGFACTYEGIKIPGGQRGVIFISGTGDTSKCTI